MTPRSKNILGLVALSFLAAVTVWLVRRTQHRESRPIDAVPAGAFLVVTIDVDLLRQSPLGVAILGGPLGRVLDDKSITATCGFDPLDRIREVAIAVPVEDDTGEFGVAVRADLRRDELLDCSRKVIAGRGGTDQFSVRASGSFTLVEPEGGKAARYPTLAYREGGPFLIAPGAWLGTMIDTADGKLPSARRESRHLSLRRALGQTSEDRSVFAAVATIILPRQMRERIRKEMTVEAQASAGDGKSTGLMAGVLGVESAGVAVAGGNSAGAETALVAELRCEDEPACGAVARLIEKTRAEWSGSPAVMLLGMRPLFDALVVEARGASVRVTTHADAALAATWLERALERSAHHPATPHAHASSNVGEPAFAAPPREGGAGAP